MLIKIGKADVLHSIQKPISHSKDAYSQKRVLLSGLF